MARLTIFYDPDDIMVMAPTDNEIYRKFDIKFAILPVAEGLEGKDIYTIARKLAEMLLEQL